MCFFENRYSQSLRRLGRPSKRKSKMQVWDTVMQKLCREVILTSAPTMQQKWVRHHLKSLRLKQAHILKMTKKNLTEQ